MGDERVELRMTPEFVEYSQIVSTFYDLVNSAKRFDERGMFEAAEAFASEALGKIDYLKTLIWMGQGEKKRNLIHYEPFVELLEDEAKNIKLSGREVEIIL